MNLKWLLAFAALFIVSELDMLEEAYGRGFRSSSRSSFSSSRSRSWSSSSSRRSTPKKSYSSSSTKKKKSYSSSPKKKSTSGYSSGKKKPTKVASKPTRKAPSAKKSTFQNKMSKKYSKKQSKTAMTKYKASKSKYKSGGSKVSSASLSKNKTYSNIRSSGNYDRGTYYARRDSFYGGYHRPSYMYNSYSSYGMYDAVFMWYMLDHIHESRYRSMYYHHRTDPAFRQFQSEAARLSRDNAELKGKLASLEGQMNTLQAKGVKVDPNHIPKGIDADLMLSEEAVATLQPTLKLCTGTVQGNYHFTGKALASESGLDVKVIPTTGSWANLKKMQSGECDAGIVQTDAIDLFGKKYVSEGFNLKKVTVMYPEYVHLVCRRDSGIESVGDLAPTWYEFWKKPKTIIAGPQSSGTNITWENFQSVNTRYKKVNTLEARPQDALKAVLKGTADCLLSVTSLHGNVIEAANANGGSVVLIDVDDSDFNDQVGRDGKDLYEFDTIPSDVYPNIQDGLFSSSIETLVVRAVLVVNSKWTQANPNGLKSLNESLHAVKPLIDNKVDPK